MPIRAGAGACRRIAKFGPHDAMVPREPEESEATIRKLAAAEE
jgi:hypothetical protein